MQTEFIKSMNSIIPEVILLVGFSCICLFYVLFKFYSKIEDTNSINFQNWFFNSFLLVTLFFYSFFSFFQVLLNDEDTFFIFHGSVWIEPSILLMRSVFAYLVFIIVYVYLFKGVYKQRGNNSGSPHSFELSVLILLIIFGMSVCLSANNFIIFYLALELQSFCFFILLFLGPSSFQSTKAGIIYFLSVLTSSIFFLVGVLYLYWTFGSLQLNELSILIYTSVQTSEISVINTVFLFFMFLGLFVKVGLVPVHLWVPNVYAFGKLFPVSLIATVSKLFGFAIILRLLITCSYNPDLFILLEFIALCSIFQGVFGALTQKSIFSLLGYSAIAHMGYTFLVLCINTEDAYVYAIFYVIVYIFNILPIFIFFFGVRQVIDVEGVKIFVPNKLTSISDFQNINLNGWKKVTAFLFFSTFFFSFIGIPPFSGFFAKFLIIKYLILTGHYFSAFVMGFLSVISAFYYLKVVKSIFFSNNLGKVNDSRKISNFSKGSRKRISVYFDITTFSAILIIFFGIINILFIFISPYLFGVISLFF